ncbi:MAG TPA: PKD domain-containing protein [Flavobacteriales bacterium]|nr:PKD domain-containing protein [Flavobacteriales bacterium]
MKYFLRIACFFSLAISAKTSTAQIDTDFWFAAPEVSASVGDAPIYLRFITYSSPATVTISEPATGGFTPVVLTIPANSCDSVNLTASLAMVESPAANVVSNNGLHITSTAPIGAFYEVKAANNKEIFSLKGSKALGMNFYTPFQKFWANAVTAPASFCSIDIVASQNATTVLITPRTAVVGHAANVTYSVTLNAGQTYSARDVNVTAATSLAGSIVSSNKPVSVTVYNGALSQSGCTSTMGDQITDAQYAGTDFIIHKGKGYNERFYVLATQNGTSITITNSTTTSTLINWSETYEYAVGTETVTYIHTSKPVYLWHASGFECSLNGAQVPNVYCAGTYDAAFTRTSGDSLGLRLYTRTGFEGMFTLNGSAALIPAAAFTTVPGTGGAFKSALIYFSTASVPLNSYNLVHNSGDVFGMAVTQGRTTRGSSYAFLSEFNSYPFVDAGPDDTICANTTLAVTGIVGGGSVTGTWGGTGYGSFSGGSTALINTYVPSQLDSLVSPIELILSSTGPCPVQRDTLVLWVEPAPIVSASADQTVCANNANVTLNGSVTGGATTGSWSTLGSGTFSPDNLTLNATYIPSALDTAAGTVTLVLTSTNFGSCNPETDTMVVTITNIPYTDAGPSTVSVCENNPDVSLNGNVSGITTTGKWTSSGTGIFSPDNLTLNATYQPSPGDVTSGSVILYLESTGNGLCNSAKDSIVVTFTPAPTVSAGSNIIQCTNVPDIPLNGSVSGPTTTGQWSGGAGTFTPNDSTLNAVYTPTAGEISAGVLFLTLTSTNNGGCTSENSTVQIQFVAPPFANFNFTEECLGIASDFTNFSLPGFGSIVNWDYDFGDGFGDTLSSPSHTYGAPGAYTVTLVVTTNVGCSDTVTQTVNAWPIPTSNFVYTSSCVGSNLVIDFTDTSTVSGDVINYWFYDFGGMGSATTENPTQLFTGSGNFTITHIVSTVHGCLDTLVTVITIPPRPSAGFYYNTDNGLNVGATFDFVDTSSNAVSWYWEFGNTNTSTVQNPSNTYFANGTYTVVQYAYDGFGCVDSAFTTITINTITTEIVQLIPNAISPNGDNKNDEWKLPFIQLLYPQATVEVFNRWGQRVFFSEGYVDPWDGTFEGSPVAQGTYYYIIDLKDESQPDPFKGTILILNQR